MNSKDKKFVDLIVMYTIRDNDQLRSDFNRLLKEKFNLQKEDELNESAYQVNGVEIPIVDNDLRQIIKQLQEEGYTFRADDFIDIYYAAWRKSETYKGKTEREKIIRHPILPEQ